MPDDELLVRTFPIELRAATLEGAGRIVEGRCVPYGVAAEVCDPGGEPYREVFHPGAFARAVRAPSRVDLRYRHGGGLADWIGRALSFAETDEGLDGSFRVLPGVFGDQALTLVDEGMLTGLSVGFRALGRRELRDGSGAVIRDRCHLEEVSLVPQGAFAGAAVTGRRAAPAGLAGLGRAELLPARDPEQEARLRAVGCSL